MNPVHILVVWLVAAIPAGLAGISSPSGLSGLAPLPGVAEPDTAGAVAVPPGAVDLVGAAGFS